jgi:hypothetical protein
VLRVADLGGPESVGINAARSSVVEPATRCAGSPLGHHREHCALTLQGQALPR